MQLLFAISVFCFTAVLWAAMALARHIKASQLRQFAHMRDQVREPAQEPRERREPEGRLFPVDRPIQRSEPRPEPTPVPVHTSEPVITYVPEPVRTYAPEPARSFRTEPIAAGNELNIPLSNHLRQVPLNQSVRDITANKQWLLPPHPLRRRRLGLRRADPEENLAGRRKPPQPARHGQMQRVDRAFFNKDLGDLTDPYQPQPRVRANDRRPTRFDKRY